MTNGMIGIPFITPTNTSSLDGCRQSKQCSKYKVYKKHIHARVNYALGCPTLKSSSLGTSYQRNDNPYNNSKSISKTKKNKLLFLWDFCQSYT